MTDGLFEHIRVLHGTRSWRTVLDAGTGRHSLEWVRAMATERWTAVTGDPGMARTLRDGPARDARPGDRLVEGNWRDPALLAGEVYDVVLADYLLGALDAFAPYHQHRLFERLRPHVGLRLYVVGLEPWPDAGDTPDAALVTEIARVRDATLLLCKERCYREHPAWWVREHLERAGFRVVSERRFGNVLGRRWVDGQLDMCTRRVARLPDGALAEPWLRYLEDVRRRAHAHCDAHGALRCGHDHVITAEPL